MLASAFVIVYLILSVTVGVVLLTAPSPESSDAVPVAGTPPFAYEDADGPAPMTAPDVPQRSDDSGALPEQTSPPATTEPPAPDTPPGYQLVSGPAGMRTVVPEGWPTARSTGPGAMQATDPANDNRWVKYGGSAAPALAIDQSHIRYENSFAARATDYRRLTLRTADYAGHEAVEWEFEHRENGSLQHVHSLYWRNGGTEYFVLAAAPAASWDGMKPVYDAMVAHASP